MSKEKSLFNVLNSVDVNEFKRKKGKYDYLSWAHAVQELLKVCPDAQWHTHEYTNKDGNKRTPYLVKFIKTWEDGEVQDADIPF